MTTQQPEALRLAESYEATCLRGHLVVAAELRSQHARIVELEAQLAAAQQAVQPDWRATMKDMVDAMRLYEMDVDGPAPEKHRAMMNRAKKLLATHPTQQGMDAIAALQKVRDIAVSALLTGSLDRQDWIDDMDRIAAQAKQGGA